MQFKYGSFLARHTAQKVRRQFKHLGFKTQIEFIAPVYHIIFNFENKREYTICIKEYNALVLRTIKIKSGKKYRDNPERYTKSLKSYFESYQRWAKENPLDAKKNKQSSRAQYHRDNKEWENTNNKERFKKNKERYSQKNKEWINANRKRHKLTIRNWQKKNTFMFDFTYPMTLNIYLREDWIFTEKTDSFRVNSYFKFNHFKKDAHGSSKR